MDSFHPMAVISTCNLIPNLLFSCHQLSEIEIISNRMVIINRGVTVVEGIVAEMLNAQEVIVKMEVEDPAKELAIITKGSTL